MTAKELATSMVAARRWLKENATDPRVTASVAAIDNMMQGAGRYLNAYQQRGKSAEERAKIALTRLRREEVEAITILQRAIAVTARCQERGIDDRQREYRHVQIAKAVHRLASGTHKTHSGFPMPVKYPRSEGQVLRHLGRWLDDIAAFALNGREIRNDSSCE